MQITITDVKVSKVKTYQVAEIAYQDYRGEAKTWKLMSFSNPATFAILKDAKAGERYEITTGKNDKDYTVWTQATKIDGAQTVAPGAKQAASSWVPDADRQRLIVKQSCLAQAVALAGHDFEGGPSSNDEVLALADKFVAWVFDTPPLEVETAE